MGYNSDTAGAPTTSVRSHTKGTLSVFPTPGTAERGGTSRQAANDHRNISRRFRPRALPILAHTVLLLILALLGAAAVWTLEEQGAASSQMLHRSLNPGCWFRSQHAPSPSVALTSLEVVYEGSSDLISGFRL